MKPAMRYHGAKWRLAPWIISHFPKHKTYVEPFGGAAGVLLQKPRAYAEVYNDLDGQIVNFFRVVRDPVDRKQLEERLILTPYARSEFVESWKPTDCPIESAARLCIRAQMGFASSGATNGTTGFRIDSARASGTAQHLWAEYPATLAAVGERFTGVLIENRPAIAVMQQHDRADTLHFVDPPYLHDTRKIHGDCYRHEMTTEDHQALLDAIKQLKGSVIISGYDHPLYQDALSGWRVERKLARISAGRGAGVRTEVIWLNPRCSQTLRAENRGTTHAKQEQIQFAP